MAHFDVTLLISTSGKPHLSIKKIFLEKEKNFKLYPGKILGRNPIYIESIYLFSIGGSIIDSKKEEIFETNDTRGTRATTVVPENTIVGNLHVEIRESGIYEPTLEFIEEASYKIAFSLKEFIKTSQKKR